MNDDYFVLLIRLRDKPRYKWTTTEWSTASRLIQQGPRGLISSVLHETIAAKMQGPARRGPKEKLTREFAEEMLGHFEKARQRIAANRGVSPDKVRDKDVAEHIAFNSNEQKNKPKYKQYGYARQLQNWTKQLKRKVKTGS